MSADLGARASWTLADLRTANERRQNEWCPDQKPDLSFRGNELAGEVGEACNVIKKLERERQGWAGSRATTGQLADELADIVICTDLVALAAGVDLYAAVSAKFDTTSQKIGLKTRLADATVRAALAGPVVAYKSHLKLRALNQGDPVEDAEIFWSILVEGSKESWREPARSALEAIFLTNSPAPASSMGSTDGGQGPGSEVGASSGPAHIEAEMVEALRRFELVGRTLFFGGHCGSEGSLRDWPAKWSIYLPGGPDLASPYNFGDKKFDLTVQDFRRARDVLAKYDAQATTSSGPALEAGMRAFGASDAACYRYPDADQAAERAAFCAGAAHGHEQDLVPGLEHALLLVMSANLAAADNGMRVTGRQAEDKLRAEIRRLRPATGEG